MALEFHVRSFNDCEFKGNTKQKSFYWVQHWNSLKKFKLMKEGTSLVSHVPPLFILGVIHPFLMVVLILGSDELPSLDLSLTKVYVPCLAFWCLCINVKLPNPEQHCNVYFIGFISSFVLQGVVLFLSISCLFSYWLWWHVFASSLLLSSSAPVSQCVLISNVCGFADGFMKKTRGQKKKPATIVWCLEMGGGWSSWSLPSLPFWHEYVCKDTNVHCGRWEHFKIEK